MVRRRQRDLRVSGATLRDHKDQILLELSAQCSGLRIRALAGGGGVFAAQGLIAPAVSGSVSLVVDPASFRHLLAALREQGWISRHEKHRFGVLPAVTTSLHHPRWLAGLTLYSVIPGFFADPEETFDLLWERRRLIPLRGVTVPSLDRVATAIFATHDRLVGRRSRSTATNFEFFATQFQGAFGQEERDELGVLVRRVGGVEEMRPLLDALDIDAGAFTLPSEGYARWRLELDDVTPDIRWMLGFLELPPHRRDHMFASWVRSTRSLRTLRSRIVQLPVTLDAFLGARKRWARAVE